MNQDAVFEPNSLPQGLTTAEVLKRQAAGQSNDAKLATSRSYQQIFNENLFTFINGVFAAISALMISLGRYGDAVLVVIVIFGGVVINIYQEIWAKLKVDRIALLSRPQANVIRNGQEQEIDPSEIVLDDLLALHPGDQILVDGQIVGQGRVEVDESLLTGESDLIPKQQNDDVFSGSFCVSGTAYYQAQKVGKATVAYKLMAGAKVFRHMLTPLQQEINLLIRVFMLISCFLWFLTGISLLSRAYPLNEVVQRAAVIAGLVPAGLILAITLAYGLGAVRMLGKDVLIQQTNAVESLSNVNVLCLDKTGTLTTNQIQLEELLPLGMTEAEFKSVLGDYVANVEAGNRTTDAIAACCGGEQRSIQEQIPFSSALKWSAIAFNDTERPGIYVLGAPEILANTVPLDDATWRYIHEGAALGLRVVLIAMQSSLQPLRDEQEQPQLPSQLHPLGVLRFNDQLRPEAKATLDGFTAAGIDLKIISGDNPKTVEALARQAGLTKTAYGMDVRVVSGTELAAMDEAQFIQAAVNNTIFGRITPDQKAHLVKTLRDQGKYVAMIGDGVNDILSLKQSNLAIAMESGSKATRGVADIVLLNDSFAALPQTFLEGQRIRNGILDVMKLFMVRGLCVTLLIFATAIVTDGFPLENKQSAVVTLIGVGFPSMCIPVWAKAGLLPQKSLVRSMLHFVVPATVTLTLVSILVYLLYLVIAILNLPAGAPLAEVDVSIPRSALVTILILGELCLIPFLKPPTTAWVGGEPLSGDWRYTITAFVLLGLYVLVIAVPPFRNFFELSHLGWLHYLFIGLVAIEWSLLLRAVWRTRFFDRFLGVKLVS